MAYPKRVQMAGAVYHIATRATGPIRFFRDGVDRVRFLRYLELAGARCGWRIHAYCQLVTHFHLVVTTPEANIARGMQLLNGWYALSFNKRHGRVGHLVASRYSGRQIEDEGHFYEVCRYVPLNPVRSQLCKRPEDWRWSSYAATIGAAPAPPFLDDGWLLEQFASDVATARRSLRRHVEDGLLLLDLPDTSEALEAA
jgi:REP-associated tyrosine transposase